MPVLHRANRLHRLQEGRDAAAVRTGSRQDYATAHDGNLFQAPALAGRGHQARSQYRALAIRHRTLNCLIRTRVYRESKEDEIMQIILQEDIEKLGARGEVVTV